MNGKEIKKKLKQKCICGKEKKRNTNRNVYEYQQELSIYLVQFEPKLLEIVETNELCIKESFETKPKN